MNSRFSPKSTPPPEMALTASLLGIWIRWLSRWNSFAPSRPTLNDSLSSVYTGILEVEGSGREHILETGLRLSMVTGREHGAPGVTVPGFLPECHHARSHCLARESLSFSQNDFLLCALHRVDLFIKVTPFRCHHL